MIKIGGMCFSWKVLAGLAAVAVAVVVLNPSLFAGALPVLIALACPLSMIFMMGGHGKHAEHDGHAGHEQAAGQPAAAAPGASCHAAGAAEPATSRAGALSVPGQPSVAELKAELAQLQDRQAALARQIAVMDEPPAVREAESIARAVQQR